MMRPSVAAEALYIATRAGGLCGAAWGQRQSGNIAVFWPPQLVTGRSCRLGAPAWRTR